MLRERAIEGNVLDALGVCGGDCLTDQNNNGICDLTELENPVGGPETCGLGTVWDEETQTCIVANPADINFDGCVQLNDLLDLLSAYGLCQTAEAAWSCGDPASIKATTTPRLIYQPWFADTSDENYENGDAIPSAERQRMGCHHLGEPQLTVWRQLPRGPYSMVLVQLVCCGL